MFIEQQSFFKAQIGEPISLQRSHIDLATLILTFVYQELVDDGKVWQTVERQQVLVQNKHYRIDKRRGVIELLDDLFWNTKGLWRAGDHTEPLLYKGHVKHPQRIEFSYEHFAPEEVEIVGEKDEQTGLTPVKKDDGTTADVDMEEFDTTVKPRLGYDLPKYGIIPNPPPKESPKWNWEKMPDKDIT